MHGVLQGDPGNLVVTYLVPEKEWRAAWEPDKGNYICSIRILLKPEGENTTVTFADWYSEEKIDLAESNMQSASNTMAEIIGKIKVMVEKGR